MNKYLALLKLIRESHPLFFPAGHASSSLGVATYMEIIVSALVPSFCKPSSALDIGPHRLNFRLSFQVPASYRNVASIVLIPDTGMPPKCGIQWLDFLRYAEIVAPCNYRPGERALALVGAPLRAM